jgi:ribose-phosphate pyrophosphokinase
MKRYSGEFDIPYAFGMKKRDWKTGNILGLDLVNPENIEGKNVLIVDDICSRGGTFYHSAKALKAAGAKSVSLYITHCEKSIAHGDLPASQLIDHVYTTHSILPEDMATGWITILE